MRILLSVCLVAGIISASSRRRRHDRHALEADREAGNWSSRRTRSADGENGINLTLHVDGPAVANARKYGKLKLTKAIDDAATDLTQTAQDAPTSALEEMREVQKPMSMGMDDKAPKPTGFDFDLNLPQVSSRKATAIKELTGQLSVLAGGKKTIVTVKSPKSMAGKSVDHPALKQLGVTFTLLDPAKQTGMQMTPEDAKRSLPAQISGAFDAIVEVRLVAAGQKLNSGASWNDQDGKRSITYTCDQDIPADAVLELEVWPGQKEVVVPFSFKDVKLP